MPTVASELRLLRPSTRCATLTPRPADYKSAGGGSALSGGTHHAPKPPSNVANAFLTSLGDFDDASSPAPEKNLTGDELLFQLKEKIRAHYPEIKQAFHSFDVDRSSFVGLEDFRKVVENFVFPLTRSQFDELVRKIDGASNQRLNYNQFMFKIKKGGLSRETPILGRVTPASDSLDNVVSKLQQKLQENGPKMSKAMRMFDIKLDGRIKKSDLKRVIENFAFHITKDQFEKLCAHFEIPRDGSCDYMSFLRSVVATQLPIKSSSSTPTRSLVIYEEEEAEKKAEEEPAEELWCETVPLVEVEIKLRNKIKHKIQLLFRTFKSMDTHGDGYITIEQLRRALNKFAFPMTDKVFEALMERMDVKAKHKLRYEAFLHKMQDRRVGGYGQTLVIKPNHRYHPVIESTEEVNLETLLEKLKSKIVSGYSSVRQAFLVFDEKRSGKISRRDFKNVIDGFCFRMTESQFAKLMTILDPGNRGAVSYLNFFQLFEDSESSAAHKWLNSVHRCNPHKTPKHLGDAEFEQLLAKKITDESKMVALAFEQYDKDNTGTVSKNQLKKFLERFNIPFSKAQFDKLASRCVPNSDGTLMFYEFMNKLGADVNGGDRGLSQKIAEETVASEFDRMQKHREKLEVVAQRALDHTKAQSTAEILVQLQDYLHQRASDMRKLFVRYDENGSGRITRAHFRRFLLKAGFLMDDAQFKELCTVMKVGKSISYQDFLDHFQRMNNAEYTEKMKTSWTPKIVPGAPVQGMSCEDGMKLFNSKIQNSYKNLRAAFHAMDRDSDGLVNRTDLAALLTKLLIPMKREDINDMWDRISDGKKRVNVQQFVSVFEETEDVSNHKWLVSVHRSNDIILPEKMTGDAVLKTFRIKALDQYYSLSKCFVSLDKDGKGKLSKKKLRQALQDFCIPINKEEFQKLWLHFDDDRTGYIDHEQFVRRAAEDFNPGDNAGTSTNIVTNSQDTAANFNTGQMCRREDLLLNQINTLQCMSNDDLEKQFRLNIHEHYPSLRTAFKAADRENLGYLRKMDLRRILFDFNFLVDDDQFEFIMKRCGMDKKSRMSYEKFLKFFESAQSTPPGIDNFDAIENRIAPHISSYPDISPAEAEARMRYCVSEIREVLLQAFGAVDLQEYGTVGADVVRRVLDNFCFIMTNKQFNYFSKKFPFVSDGSVDYKQFLENFSIIDTEECPIDIDRLKKDSKAWLEAVLGPHNGAKTPSSRLSNTPSRLRRASSCSNLLAAPKRPPTAPFVSAEHVENNIDGAVTDNWMELHKYFKSKSSDYTTVPTDAFKGGLSRVGIKLSEGDLDTLCRKYDVHGNNSVSYSAFLKRFSAIGRVSSRNSDRDSHMSLRSGRISSFSYNLSRAASCTSLDSRPESTRSVSRSLVSQMSLRRSTTNLGDLTPGPGINPPEYVISNIASHVVSNWKQLRKEFKSYDTKSRGWISTQDFRSAMRSNHVDISESDFSDLVHFYDSQSAGKVYYNDFLRAFLSLTTVD